MASHDAISRGLAVLHESFPNRPITQDTAPIWHKLFARANDDVHQGPVVFVEIPRAEYELASKRSQQAKRIRAARKKR